MIETGRQRTTNDGSLVPTVAVRWLPPAAPIKGNKDFVFPFLHPLPPASPGVEGGRRRPTTSGDVRRRRHERRRRNRIISTRLIGLGKFPLIATAYSNALWINYSPLMIHISFTGVAAVEIRQHWTRHPCSDAPTILKAVESTRMDPHHFQGGRFFWKRDAVGTPRTHQSHFHSISSFNGFCCCCCCCCCCRCYCCHGNRPEKVDLIFPPQQRAMNKPSQEDHHGRHHHHHHHYLSQFQC